MTRCSNYMRYCAMWVVCLCISSVLQAQDYDVRLFGALADGVTDNTKTIQQALDSCAIHGGKVIIPKGNFVTATLFLKSNTTLYLSAGAVLLGSTDIKQYPYLNSGISFYGEEWAKQALIFCRDANNVTIEGEGTIDGRGASFPVTTDKKPDRYRNRPYLLWFAGAKNIRVSNIHLRNSAFWMQHYLGCENVKIDGLDIWNHSNKNNDMMDIDGCRFVTISNIRGDSDDDGITIKSTSPLISQDITITNCVLSSHCNALKFGTESTGGFRNITVSNIVIKPSSQTTTIYGKPAGNGGLAMELVDGGIMENISISNLVIDGPQVPIFVKLGNRARKYNATAAVPPIGSIKNIKLSHILAVNADDIGCSISGIPGKSIEDISLDDVTIQSKGMGTKADAEKKIEEMENAYPEGTMFGKLSSYGLFVRHVNGIRLSNITLKYDSTDRRPGLALVDVHRFSLNNIDIQHTKSTSALITVEKSTDGYIGVLPFVVAKQVVTIDASSKNIINTIVPKSK
ncbi:MAG: glycosyl hydrolase family 28 protein [Bacteroidota bacterium]